MWPWPEANRRESFCRSLAKQVLSGKMDAVIKTIERNVRLVWANRSGRRSCVSAAGARE